MRRALSVIIIFSVLICCKQNTNSSLSDTLITKVKIRELEGKDNSIFPVTLSHVFKDGDVSGAVAVVADGKPVTSQTDIKSRWSSGSVKHALISFLLPELSADSEVEVVLHRDGNLNTAENADLSFALNSKVKCNIDYTGSAEDVELLSMIGSEDSSKWLAGQVANEITVTDFKTSAGKINTHASIRVYNGYPGVRIFLSMENVRSDGGGTNETYSVSVNGKSEFENSEPFDKVVFEKNNILQRFDTRYPAVFWIGKAPSKSQIIYDRTYLLSTGLIPSYDKNLDITSAEIEPVLTLWNTCGKEFGEPGLLNRYFPSTGWRMEIGLLPQWAVMYILTMDSRLEDIVIGHGLLSGGVQVHVRESKSVNTAYGRFISVDDRPEVWLGDNRGSQADAVVRDVYGYDWTVDRAHQGSISYLPYIITGDRFFLEELTFWGAWDIAASWPSPRQNEKGIIKDQVRGDAWTLREIARAASLSPDNSLEKKYFMEKLNNTADYWIKTYITDGYHPLGVWEYISARGLDGGRPTEYFGPEVRYISTPWQEHFLIQSLSHASKLLYGEEVGDKIDKVLGYAGNSMIQMIKNLGPQRAFSYRLPVSVITGENKVTDITQWEHITEWTKVESCYIKDVSKAPQWEKKDPVPAGWENPQEGYPKVWLLSNDFPESDSHVCSAVDYPFTALAASSCIIHLTGGNEVYGTIKDLLKDELNAGLLKRNPTFAIVPGR